MSNPVGWSSTTPPQYMTNRDPNVSEVARRALMSPQQSLGAMMMRKPGGLLNADLPEAEAKAQTAVDYGMAVAGATNPIRAFHGSPHMFNRFDMSKLGTGEGAQAYGHGLYFAGNEGVARSYKTAGQPTHLGAQPAQIAQSAFDQAVQSGATDPVKAAREILWDKRGGLTNPTVIRHLDDAMNNMEQFTKPGALGSMYEVNLRTSPERLLDWDKPLAGQGGLKELAQQVAGSSRLSAKKLSTDATGADLYHAMRSGFPAQKIGYENWSTSGPGDMLKKRGIDGIQYLDGGSRAAGEGSRNYVMFDDKLIDILRRYGILGTAGGGAAGLLSQEPAQ